MKICGDFLEFLCLVDELWLTEKKEENKMGILVKVRWTLMVGLQYVNDVCLSE